jgi:type VI secretion system protein ImpG
MHPKMLDHYSQEYAHLREMGREFARVFPKVAGRLTLDSSESQVPDPYVERLLEGFAFLAARVQLKLDAEFPRFTQHVLEMSYPHYAAPTPSMAVVQFTPKLTQGDLAVGFQIPRQTMLRSRVPAGLDTSCEFRTAHPTTLWPIEIRDVRYQFQAPDLPLSKLPLLDTVRGVLRIRLGVTAGLTCDRLKLDRLTFFLSGRDEHALKLYELIFASAMGALVVPRERPVPWFEFLDASAIKPVGFDNDEALIPYGSRSFSGYRLLHEYFAFPERFRFFELTGLQKAFSRCKSDEIEIAIPLARADAQLEPIIDREHLALFCTPAINLFAKSSDRAPVSDQHFEQHIVLDRSHPMDFEVYQVAKASGYAEGVTPEATFRPFYTRVDADQQGECAAYFTTRREPRMLSQNQKQFGTRTSYVGSEVFLSLVDARDAPYPNSVRHLGAEVLATNRDLPLLMPIGSARDFDLRIAAPVEGIRCIRGPSRPIEAIAERETAWRLVSHLSLNYLSLMDLQPEQGAAALRELLELYAPLGNEVSKRQIEGVRHVSVSPRTGRVPGTGPIVFARGLNIQVTVNETSFAGASAFLLGAVLEQFFTRHASMNTFTQLSIASETRGQIKQWNPRIATRPIA